MNNKKIHCLRCIHYFSTHDPAQPRGCKLYQFKTKNIPAMIVKRETGSDCLGYKERKIKKEDSFHDKKFW